MARKKDGDGQRPYANDPRTVEELIQAAIEEWDQESDTWPDALAILRLRGGRDTLAAAQRLCVSKEVVERALGAAILSQLGAPDHTFPQEAVTTLMEMLHTETNGEVLGSICSALGNYDRTPEIINEIIKHKRHPDERARFGVVIGLLFHPSDEAISTLIELSNDPDDDVRDWATFGIGQMTDTEDYITPIDSPAIREALYARLDDEDWETGFEALSGLAIRRDTQIIDRIVGMLARNEPRFRTDLCEALRDMLEHYTGTQEQLDLALSRCDEEDAENQTDTDV